MSSRPEYRLHDSIGYQLSIATRIQERRLEEQLKTLGLTRVTWCVILAVGVEGRKKPSEIAEFVGIDRTATSRALRQLEQGGLIARAPGVGSDGRTIQVELTERGEKVLRQGKPMAEESNAVIASYLGTDDLDALSRILRRLRDAEDRPIRRL